MFSRRALAYGGLGLLSVVLFIFDAFVPSYLAVELLYVAVILLTLFVEGRWATLFFGGVSTIFIVAGAGVQFVQPEPIMTLGNHGVALLGLWTAVVVVSAYKHVLQARQASEARAQSILETAVDGIVTIDEDGSIESFNPAAEAIFGYDADEVIGRPAKKLLDPDERESFDRLLTPSPGGSTKEMGASRRELDGRHQNGSTVPIELSVSATEVGDRLLYTCVVRDVTDRKRGERRLQTQYRMAQILTESDSLDDAAPRLLEAIGKELPWEWGELWIPNAEDTRLENVEIWRAEPQSRPHFSTKTHETKFALGDGLPGTVWETQRPKWISNVQNDDLFVRAQAATDADVRTGFAVPIQLGSTVFGVMVFFSSEEREPEDALVQMFSVLGNQIGQFTDRRRTEEALQRTAEQLSRAQEVARLGSWEYDLATGDLIWSDQMYRLFGVDEDTFTPDLESVLEAIPSEDRNEFKAALQKIPDEQTSFRLEHRIRIDHRSERWVFTQAELDADEKCLIGTTLDVTELKQTKKALEESEARAQAILNTTVDGIITIDARGTIESFNQAAEEIFGYEAEEVIGKNVKILMPPPYRDEHDDYLQRYHETGRREIIGIGREVTGRRKDGSTFPMDLAVSEVDLGDRTIFTGIVRDISERRRLEQEILNISEQERRRIGQDLHDGLGQMLTGIGLLSQDVTRQLKEEGHERADDMAEITEHVKEADQYARDLSHGLIPVDVEAGGLTEALRRLADNAERLFDVTCAFQNVGGTHVENSTVASHLYRIAQEAVSNATRHGGADRVKVILAGGENQMRLQVRDDGRGFETDETDGGGMGVHIMNYRARIIGGTLEIESTPGEGTTVTCTLPRSTYALNVPESERAALEE